MQGTSRRRPRYRSMYGAFVDVAGRVAAKHRTAGFSERDCTAGA